MTGRRGTIAFLAVAGFLMAAYDTGLIASRQWQSIYQAEDLVSVAEHTSISDDTFDFLNRSGQLRALFGRSGTARLDLVDLNASHFRRDLLHAVDPFGDDPDTEVEERTLPPPGLFAGLPDYSYAIYDWINKNRTCPAFNTAQYTEGCHEFIGWLGALNSVHFGSQARLMYAHLHENALVLARRASEMRLAMSDQEREAYEAEIREAELLALAYEGYAQHFLQDRWAIGHMWERWNAPDTVQEPAALHAHLAIGMVAGLIHGAEAVVTKHELLEYLLMRADPMSSPLPGDNNTAIPMQYRHVRADNTMSEPLPGAGDERYEDMNGHNFSLSRYDNSRTDQVFQVDAQLNSLRQCAGAGWAEVIRALGPGDSSGYGSYNAPIDSTAPTFAVLDNEECWNAWATNRSMMIGLLGPNAGRSVALLATLDIALPATDGVGSADNNLVVSDRTELVAYATRLWMYGRDTPDGTEVSRGQMTSLAGQLGALVGWGEAFDPNTLWGFQSGQAYTLPNYVSPIGLESEGSSTSIPPLADSDNRGRDIQTFYGYFNGAHSDYWCENRELLSEWRADPSPMNREMCEHLAQRIFQGTHPVYQGLQTVRRQHDEQEVRSLCQIRETSGVESDTEDDRSNPYWLDQGYVPAHPTRQSLDPVFTDFEAVTNWCARVPVIALSTEPELRDLNVVARVAPDASRLVLTGWDLGEETGSVSLTDILTRETIELNVISYWNETEINADLTNVQLQDGSRYQLNLSVADGSGPDPVGLYYVLVESVPELETRRLDLTGISPCMEPMEAFQLTDLDPYLDAAFNPAAFTQFAEEYSRDARILRDYLERQAGCMQALHDAAQPLLEEQIFDAVAAVVATEGRYRSDGYVMGYAVPLDVLGNEDETVANAYLRSYIRETRGLVWLLDRAANLVEAWDTVLNGEEFLSRDPNVGASELLQGAITRELAVELGFTDEYANMVPAGLPPEATQALRDVQSLMLEEQIGFDLRSVNSTTRVAAEAVLEGLPRWTQLHQTLTLEALPQHRALGEQVMARANAALRAALADGAAEWCIPASDGTCIVGTAPIDTAAYDRSAAWITSMYPINTMTLVGAGDGLFFAYVDETGTVRDFMEWPTADQAERARNGSEALQ